MKGMGRDWFRRLDPAPFVHAPGAPPSRRLDRRLPAAATYRAARCRPSSRQDAGAPADRPARRFPSSAFSLLTIAICVLATLSCSPKERPRHNVLLITLDTTRADHVNAN